MARNSDDQCWILVAPNPNAEFDAARKTLKTLALYDISNRDASNNINSIDVP
jgi:hypothetical protein